MSRARIGAAILVALAACSPAEPARLRVVVEGMAHAGTAT